MAIFGLFKSGGDKDKDKAGNGGGGSGNGGGGGNGAGAGDSGGMDFSPEKAKRFFDRAKSVHDTGQYEYAMSLWLQGIRFEPTNIEAMKRYFDSADQYRAAGNTSVSKETTQAITGKKTPVDRFVVALLNWSLKIREPDAAVAVTVAPAELSLTEITRWIGQRTLAVCKADPKPRKDWFVKMMNAFWKVQAYDMAAQAGELAMILDPADNKLSADVRNLAAQSTMSKGGYENTGQEGGFRANVRDSDKQRLIEEEKRGIRSEEGMQRLLLAAKAEYEANPGDKPTIRKYLKTLGERGTPTDEVTAIEIAEKAYVETQEFLFRRFAGEMRMKRGRKELKALREALDKTPTDAAAREAFLKAEQTLLELEIVEYEGWVAAYPTDLKLKFEMGKRYLLNKQFDQAVQQFQVAKDEGKQRSEVMSFLGQAFVALDWLEEAIATYKAALEQHADQNDPAGLELRYGLMASLMRKAEQEKDLPSGLEADKIASSIAVQQIGYKDIRARRDQLKALIAQLRQGGTAGAASA